jgi:hypothetical protein
VLYAENYLAGAPPTPEYEWAVDPVIEERAREFVNCFRALFGESLPRPGRDNADAYWAASRKNAVAGRCVRIGADDGVLPIKHYHWAIKKKWRGKLSVIEFWDSEIWTTARYREHQGYASESDPYG